MGVFKWLRRERLTVTTRQLTTDLEEDQQPAQTRVGTIRTEEYKRDLAEFQARRSTGSKELTPQKKKCGRHSLPVSCAGCTGDPDTTFNYEKKSTAKYKKRTQKIKSSTSSSDTVPNIQFLFQNQVFLPGNMFSYSEPTKSRNGRVSKSPDSLKQRHIDFNDEQLSSPPLFYKNNSLAFDVKSFLDTCKDDVDGLKGTEELVQSSHGSPVERKDDSGEEKMWGVMSELRNFDRWADEQLHAQSVNTTKSEENKSDASVYGLPLTSPSDLSVTADKTGAWQPGKWGVVPVQIKKLVGVTIEHVKKKRNTEINILRKYRHPNIILLMGLYADVQNNVNIICERCTDSLYGILHEQGRIISVQTSVQYSLDIANALLYLRMQGYMHTRLSSASIAVTSRDTAKIADLSPCVQINKHKRRDKFYSEYSPEPQYINIEDTSEQESNNTDSVPLLPVEGPGVVSCSHAAYRTCPQFRWQAPELFGPDEKGMVHPCPGSDVYSLALVLWECCNAEMPFKELQYDQLASHYSTRSAGIELASDGSYPGALLSLLRSALQVQSSSRPDLSALRDSLQALKYDLDEMEYIILPTRFNTKTNSHWDTTSRTDSDCLSPKVLQHSAVVHKPSGPTSPLYETIHRDRLDRLDRFDSVDDAAIKYHHLPEKDFSSACSTPIAKLRARIKELDTPCLHKSDSTEYCSILSPDSRIFGDSMKDPERSSAKLSRSFTPQSYKPLHIKVPEFDLDSIRSIVKDAEMDKPSYNFDIRNYSLPTTPIARSNKLRKNAWLSGDIGAKERSKTYSGTDKASIEDAKDKRMQNTSMEPEGDSETSSCKRFSGQSSTGSEDTARDSFTGLKRVGLHEVTSAEPGLLTPRAGSWSRRSSRDSSKSRPEEEALAHVYVKPLVAIHERWILEANRKTQRSMSLPEDDRKQWQAVKPASHRVDTLQQSLPQLGPRRPRPQLHLPQLTQLPQMSQSTQFPQSPHRAGFQWDQYSHTRDVMSKSVNFAFESELNNTLKKDSNKGSSSTIVTPKEPKVDQSTNTCGIENFIRDLIRREFQHLINEMSEDSSTSRQEEMLNKGVANVLEGLKTDEAKRENVKFSRVKINGNNKPLLQITFSRNGENSLQVLDNCVNVTICDGNTAKEKPPDEETLTADDLQVNSLKRCQAFNAIQEARSTEDLYIDDDLSAQLQENFGGRVKLIPLHGSLHEILCEKEDDCCLIKVKQENGCDTIYFRCDSEVGSRDYIDGREAPRDGSVVFKRSISIEERVQRVIPKRRPKSEVFPKISQESKSLSTSSPSLMMHRPDEVEVNIENVMCYQDSSSDECLKCQDDDFEMLEREIEADIGSSVPLNYGCLEKISEENLSVINEENAERN